jgi:hypothetical protein
MIVIPAPTRNDIAIDSMGIRNVSCISYGRIFLLHMSLTAYFFNNLRFFVVR